jgi:hypothetical protein
MLSFSQISNKAMPLTFYSTQRLAQQSVILFHKLFLEEIFMLKILAEEFSVFDPQAKQFLSL